MRIYYGYRQPDGCGLGAVQVLVREFDPHGTELVSAPLAMQREIMLHSNRFNWGDANSASAQLGLALVADSLGVWAGSSDTAKCDVIGIYRPFTKLVVKVLPMDGWMMTAHQVRAVLDEIRAVRRSEKERHG